MKNILISIILGCVAWIFALFNNLASNISQATNMISQLPTGPTDDEITRVVEAVITLFGSIIASIIMKLIKKKFPNIFTKKK